MSVLDIGTLGDNQKSAVPFVYGLSDPREPDHIRYVGASMHRRRRPFDHYAAAGGSTSTYCHKLSEWVRQLRVTGLRYSVSILIELPDASHEHLDLIERYYIAQLRLANHQLLNISDGGRGRRAPHNEETRTRMSEAQKDRAPMSENVKLKIAATLTCYVHSAEMRERVHLALLGRPCSQETRSKISASQTGKVVPEETCKKISASLTGKIASNTAMARMSASQDARLADPEVRRQIGERSKAVWARRKATARILASVLPTEQGDK